jgi:hypothetical protein
LDALIEQRPEWRRVARLEDRRPGRHDPSQVRTDLTHFVDPQANFIPLPIVALWSRAD